MVTITPELASTVDLENSDQLPVKEVKYSIYEIPTELPCSGDLENPV